MSSIKFACVELTRCQIFLSHLHKLTSSLNHILSGASSENTQQDTKSTRLIRLHDLMVDKLSKKWMKWQQSESSWKRKTVSWGTKVLENITYEEHFLKTIPIVDNNSTLPTVKMLSQVIAEYIDGNFSRSVPN